MIDIFGLSGLSEEGLEALNENIRNMSTGARKDSTVHNFMYTFNNMWDRSRPKIVDMKRKINWRSPKFVVATEIEALVESMFVEEESYDD